MTLNDFDNMSIIGQIDYILYRRPFLSNFLNLIYDLSVDEVTKEERCAKLKAVIQIYNLFKDEEIEYRAQQITAQEWLEICAAFGRLSEETPEIGKDLLELATRLANIPPKRNVEKST